MTVEKFLAAIKSIESKGDYKAKNSGSSAGGAYQFIDATWKALGGPDGPAGAGGKGNGHAAHATKEKQDEIAKAYATKLAKKYSDDWHKMARAWNQGEPAAEKDANAGKGYADKVKALMG